MKSTLLARYIVFLPINVYCHIHSGQNTSFVGNDKNKIEDLFKISIRMKNVALDYCSAEQANVAKATMGHHIYQYYWMLKKIVWRLSYNDIIELLHKYPPYEQSGNKLINITIKYPRFYAVLSQVARPILLSAVWVKNKLRKS
jgi:hypothetical protein